MITIFKSLKDTYGHKKNDFLYKITEDFYQWEKEPKYMVDAKIVENFKDDYEQHIINWERGETIYFLSSDGVIIEEEFHPSLHSTLVHYGNSFKHINDVKVYKEKLNSLLSDIEESFILSKNDLLPLISLIKKGESEKVIKILNKYLI